MGVLVWIARAIILLLILRFVLRLLFGTRRPLARGPAPASGGPMERAGGELVRDPQCGTYIPKGRAIAAGTGTGTTYFCSTACKNAFDAKTARAAGH